MGSLAAAWLASVLGAGTAPPDPHYAITTKEWVLPGGTWKDFGRGSAGDQFRIDRSKLPSKQAVQGRFKATCKKTKTVFIFKVKVNVTVFQNFDPNPQIEILAGRRRVKLDAVPEGAKYFVLPEDADGVQFMVSLGDEKDLEQKARKACADEGATYTGHNVVERGTQSFSLSVRSCRPVGAGVAYDKTECT